MFCFFFRLQNRSHILVLKCPRCKWRQRSGWRSMPRLAPSGQAPPPQPVASEETHQSVIVRTSTLGSPLLSASFHVSFHFGTIYYLSSSSSRQLFLPFMTSTWRSGGWRRWTPAVQTVEPHLTTATFIVPHQSPTAAGLWTSGAPRRRCTTTELWLTLVGRCRETSRRWEVGVTLRIRSYFSLQVFDWEFSPVQYKKASFVCLTRISPTAGIVDLQLIKHFIFSFLKE